MLDKILSCSLLSEKVTIKQWFGAILGFVGAGGIGEQLTAAIQWTYGADVTAIFVLLIVTVIALDYISRWLRGKLIATGATITG